MSSSVTDIIPNDFADTNDKRTFCTNQGVFNSGLTQQEVAEYYDNWAWTEQGDYDSLCHSGRYTGPEQTAKRVIDFFSESERSKVRVLDVAAGTGRIGVALFSEGFRHIDALDPSEGMLKKAKARGVYTNHIQEFIGGDHKVPVQNDHYDALACCGGLGEGHIPASAMSEMIRIVRPGGLICLTTREEYLPNQPEYQETMDQLASEGKWKLVNQESVDNYFLTKRGCVYQFRVL